MRVVQVRSCGLDVHKRTVVACVLLTGEDGSVRRFVRTFGTMTGELLALSDWLERLGVGPIALESTGVYWRPVFNLLEGEGRELVLVNPQHVKATPTDCSHWQHGLSGRGRGGHGSDASAVRLAPASG